MPGKKNRHGLDRDIPDPIKRLVRQRCHFGCVICGRSIVEYEHFNPVFANARTHEADGICLLCPNCHAKKTRNLLSAGRLREAAANPICARAGFSFDELEAQNIPPYIVFCGSLLYECETVISVAGWPLLAVNAPEAPHAPHALSASFFNSDGRPSLLLRHNEWVVLSDQWDAELTSNTITIRSGAGDIGLRLTFKPGAGIIVDRLNMLVAGYHFLGDAESFTVQNPLGNKTTYAQWTVPHCPVGMEL